MPENLQVLPNLSNFNYSAYTNCISTLKQQIHVREGKKKVKQRKELKVEAQNAQKEVEKQYQRLEQVEPQTSLMLKKYEDMIQERVTKMQSGQAEKVEFFEGRKKK